MKLTLELSTSRLVVSSGFQQLVTSLRQKYGEAARIEVEVLREGEPITPTELEEFIWVIKPVNEFAAASILGGCEAFSWDASIERFVGEANYNTDHLKQLLSWDESVEAPMTAVLWAELSWRVNSSAGWQRTQIVDFTLENILFKGSETFPDTGSPIESGGPWKTPLVRVSTVDTVNNNATANTLADITDLKFPVEAGHRYHFRFVIPYSSAVTTTGSRFTITGPASPTTLLYQSDYPLTVASETNNRGLGSYGLPALSNASTPSSGGLAVVEGMIQPSADGYVQAQFASEISGSAVTALAGGHVQYTRLD